MSLRIGVQRVAQRLALVVIISIAAVARVHAQDVPPGCSDICAASCLKPWALADRWNDNTWPTAQGWSNNGVWDREIFTDTNGNGRHDPGEPFIDGSSAYTKGGAGPMDGVYNEEYYDPINTGYVAWKDLGLELTLKLGSPGAAPAPSRYYAVDLPGSIGANDFRWNIANCNPTVIGPGDTLASEGGNMAGPTGQGLRDLIDRDPGAYWDDGCQCVESEFEASPRILILPVYDPRVPPVSGKPVVATKLVGFFLESADVNGNMKGRFTTAKAPGGTACAEAARFLYDCPAAAEPTTWGRIKATWR